MSKTQILIDAARTSGDFSAIERQLAKPAITDWSRKLLTDALAESTHVPATADPAIAKNRKLHTFARTVANAVKRSHFHATGENLTYEDACAMCGTAKASSGSPVLAKRPSVSQAKLKAMLAEAQSVHV